MKYLCFQNKGEINLYNLLLMGASTKRNDDSKIGNYGSGWKYALATLLREQIPFLIFSGKKYLQIRTQKLLMSGEYFDMIIVENKESMTTTDLGPDWTAWMALREIYCNAIDEGTDAINILKDTDAVYDSANSDTTLVAIGITEEVQFIIDRWQEYFSFERTDDVYKAPGLTVYEKRHPEGKSIIYRKGIKVGESSIKGCYDYDFENLPINEIRQLKDFSYVEDSLKNMMRNNISEEVLKVLLETPNTWERDVNFHYWESIYNKQTWEKVIGNRVVVPKEYSRNFTNESTKPESIIKLPATMAELIANQMKNTLVLGVSKDTGVMVIPFTMNDEDRSSFDEIIAGLSNICDIDLYTFSVSEFKNNYSKITHAGNEIVLSKDLVKAKDIELSHRLIMKEIYLIHSGCSVLTEDFENYLVDDIISLKLELSSFQKKSI